MNPASPHVFERNTTDRIESLEAGDTLAAQIYERLRDDIILATLLPDQKLTMELLKERYDAGMTPLREALYRLSSSMLLTAQIRRPKRVIYLSSSMHRGGHTSLAGMDWSGRTSTGSYSDSKLFVTTLAAAVARLWPDVLSNAVDPGWVPTKMGGPGAPDDLRLGHVTQEWLATRNEPEALTSGGYWHHQRREPPHPAVNDIRFQDQLLAEIARATDTQLG